jgi:hypothetical protein
MVEAHLAMRPIGNEAKRVKADQERMLEEAKRGGRG